MERLEGCKGCTESVKVTPEKLELLIAIAVKGRTAVSDQEYVSRMDMCLSCPALQYGTTCRYCGCLVAVRARLQDSICPFPVVPRWC
ncbi:hypothetical protein [Paenibacillus sp. FSL K6-2524]|uniref:hypothetical protein n=1 Tax=Paenibacillus sp. FSL K6-2524 TaxID=2954516 RepID=UPI0030F78429